MSRNCVKMRTLLGFASVEDLVEMRREARRVLESSVDRLEQVERSRGARRSPLGVLAEPRREDVVESFGDRELFELVLVGGERGRAASSFALELLDAAKQ